MGQGGKAGRITQLKTTQGFEHPDGMRAYQPVEKPRFSRTGLVRF
jgi:hypothetical protein